MGSSGRTGRRARRGRRARAATRLRHLAVIASGKPSRAVGFALPLRGLAHPATGPRDPLDRLDDAEISFNDERFWIWIEKPHELDRPADGRVTRLADPGAGCFEHGRCGDGETLSGEEIRMPLAIHFRADGRGARAPATATRDEEPRRALETLGGRDE